MHISVPDYLGDSSAKEKRRDIPNYFTLYMFLFSSLPAEYK